MRVSVMEVCGVISASPYHAVDLLSEHVQLLLPSLTGPNGTGGARPRGEVIHLHKQVPL